MKTTLLFGALMLAGHFCSDAQQAFTTTEYIDIGNIRAGHQVHGDMWRDLVTPGWSNCEFPKGSGNMLGNLGSLWTSGYDAQAKLHISAQVYRQGGNDYWPGPATDPIYTTDTARSAAWNRIWKVNRSNIDFFLGNATHTTANTPLAILEWPAKDNPYAKGSAGHPLSITRDMAPFVDVNNDGHYNALDGDYPQIKGDQMLWWIITDMGPTHSETYGVPLGIEIRNSVYAYHRSTVADNIIFYEFLVSNKSAQAYNHYRLGFNSDLDIGYAHDDTWAFDSTRRMGIGFNQVSSDPSYGTNIPAAGIVQLEVPADQPSQRADVGSFTYYLNDATVFGNPDSAVHYNHLLRQKHKDGSSFDRRTLYRTDSTACVANLPATIFTDARFVITSPDDSFAVEQTLKYAFALVVSPNAGACPNPDFTGITNTADTAWKIYANPLPAQPTIIKNAAGNRSLHIYPNPATDVLYVDVPDGEKGTVRIYDATGRIIKLQSVQKDNKIIVDTAPVTPGIYTIEYYSGNTKANNIFVKQ